MPESALKQAIHIVLRKSHNTVSYWPRLTIEGDEAKEYLVVFKGQTQMNSQVCQTPKAVHSLHFHVSYATMPLQTDNCYYQNM